MTRVLVVDDEPQILRALGINLRRAATTSTSRPTVSRRSISRRVTTPMSSSSTSGFPGSTASR